MCAELGSGNGTGFPNALDTDSSLEYNDGDPSPTAARAAVPNDLAAAIIAIETELGTNPKRSSTSIATRFGDLAKLHCPGRLTLTTATPITTADVTAATTLYYTPYLGDTIYLYESSIWEPHALTERSLNISGFTASLPYDIFIYDNSGTLTLSGTAWTNATTRATAITKQNGIYVKDGATSYRYLGTICMTAVAGQCEDSLDFMGVWNYYNRVRRLLKVIDGTDTWNYTTATWRQANNAAGNKVEFVIGVSENPVEFNVLGAFVNTNADMAASVGIGLDVTNANSALLSGGSSAVVGSYVNSTAYYGGYPGIGYHYLAWLEYSVATGTTTWAGDRGGTIAKSGMCGEMWG